MNESLPAKWQEKKLKDMVLEMGDGGTPSTSNPQYFGGEIPWVVIDDITRDITKTKTTITKEGLNNSSAKLWDKGAVILSTGATIGKVGIAQIPLTTKQGIIGIICKESLCNTYLYYLLQHSESILKKLSQGSTIREIRIPTLGEINFLFPTLIEQKKIAEILASVDEFLERKEAQLKKYNALKNGLLHDLFADHVRGGHVRCGTLNNPTTNLPRLAIEQVAKVIDSLHQTPNFSPSGFAMVRVTDIKTGDISLKSALRVTKEVYQNFTRNHTPKRGDILMSRVGSYGISSYINTDEPLCIGQNTVVIHPQNIDGLYLYYALNSPSIKKQIEFEVAGSGYKSLSLSSLKALFIPVPAMTEQLKISSSLRSVDNTIENIKAEIVKHTFLKTALMQDLLTGKVRVPVN